MPTPDLLNVIADGGSFALCVFLVIYVMRESSKREDRLMAMLDKYSEKIGQMAKALELIESKIPMGMGLGHGGRNP
jgi:hypothetical protein